MLQRIRKLFGEPKKAVDRPDLTPMELPINYQRPESLEEAMRRLIRSEGLAAFAQSRGKETFEEAEDFDVDDDSEFDSRPTQFEEVFDEETGRHVLPGEKAIMDKARADFDSYVNKKRAASRRSKIKQQKMEELHEKEPKVGTPTAAGPEAKN